MPIIFGDAAPRWVSLRSTTPPYGCDMSGPVSLRRANMTNMKCINRPGCAGWITVSLRTESIRPPRRSSEPVEFRPSRDVGGVDIAHEPVCRVHARCSGVVDHIGQETCRIVTASGWVRPPGLATVIKRPSGMRVSSPPDHCPQGSTVSPLSSICVCNDSIRQLLVRTHCSDPFDNRLSRGSGALLPAAIRGPTRAPPGGFRCGLRGSCGARRGRCRPSARRQDRRGRPVFAACRRQDRRSR
jgi:hypothetical protein